MNNYNKNNDYVRYGIKGELICKFYIEYVKHEQFKRFNHDDEFDLLSSKSTYEIKTDSNFIKYNSIFLEYESYNKPSGINTSKADFYIFVCPNNKDFEIVKIFEIKTKILKEIINNNILVEKIAPCKDYYNNTYAINKGYIIPKTYLIKFGSTYEIKINDFEELKNI